jgi:hypothetical protein
VVLAISLCVIGSVLILIAFEWGTYWTERTDRQPYLVFSFYKTVTEPPPESRIPPHVELTGVYIRQGWGHSALIWGGVIPLCLFAAAGFIALGTRIAARRRQFGAVEQMTEFGVTQPTEQQKSLVDEALYLRGRIVASYAQVEFLLADVSVKLDLRFPYLIDSRIKAVRRIAERSVLPRVLHLAGLG